MTAINELISKYEQKGVSKAWMLSVIAMIGNNDVVNLKKVLHQGNQSSIGLFNAITGRKVKTDKEIEATLREIDNPAYQAVVDKHNTEIAMRKKEFAKKQMFAELQVKIRHNGEIKTIQQFIDGITGEGYIQYSEVKKGAVNMARLGNEKGSFYEFRKKSERDYIKSKLNLEGRR